ncbi:non-ribosomal peptide synthetase [Alteromonas stellipolaris]|uniref:non-ribosomal peptide synthetase n=1 Tax=Alteromonas stellipolaris TaxID=233316 RepID=UPI001D945A6E|nr:non-ribosomal peptide synthetase [Alteromonas stellipolaris]MBZ2163252.1 amino acid adenylation domain-containing protein [Alteromonas stellipolaris]
MINKLTQQWLREKSRLAIAEGEKFFTYEALEGRANRLANCITESLQKQSLTSPKVMPIVAYRSVDYVVAVLACWKLGLGVAPLASDTPQKRLAFIIDDLQSTVLLDLTASVVCVEGCTVLDADIDNLPADVSAPKPHGEENIAYVIYTSGTTGQPKGCLVGFESLEPVVASFVEHYGINPDSKVTFAANIAFDAAMLEWLPALTQGASVHILDKQTLLNQALLVDFYQKHQITFSWLPTPVAEMLMNNPDIELPQSLETIQTAGQRLSVRPPEAWHTVVENAYGPTETTVIATSSRVSPEGNVLPDIGKPLKGILCFVLDSEFRPVEIGIEGELHIGGVGVSRGYFGKAALTAQQFFHYGDEQGRQHKVYATGDICRLNKQGNLEFVGRKDKQVKLQGHRIECAEVVYQLCALPKVSQAHVICQTLAGQQQLVAYVRAHDNFDIGNIRTQLQLVLPDYMVPSHFMAVDDFPLTPNGKLDESRLPAIELPKNEHADNDELSEQQAAFLAVFRHHLGGPIGWQDDYFNAGGNSIAAISIAAEVYRNWSLVLPFSLFETEKTPEKMCFAINTASFDSVAIEADATTEAISYAPLSSSQRAIWFLSNLDPLDRAYHAKARLNLSGDVNTDAVAHALQMVTNRNGIFRTAFVSGDGEGLQQVHRDYKVDLLIYDYSSQEPATAEQQLEYLISEELNRPFELAQLPLVRWALVAMPRQQSVLIHIEHHMIHDGWSYNLFLREFLYFYRAYSGEDAPMPAMPGQYADFCRTQNRWLAEDGAQRQKDYWCKQLKDAPVKINLPRVEDGDGRHQQQGQTLRIKLPRKKWQQVETLAQQRGETAFSILLSAYNLMLHRYANDDDVCVGSAFANRNWLNADSIIGMMINTVVLRSTIDRDMTVEQLLAQTYRTVSQAQNHQDLPFEQVVEALNPATPAGVNPLFQVFFGFHDSPMPAIELPGIKGSSVIEAIDSRAAKFDLSVVVIPRTGQLGKDDPVHMLWEFKHSAFSQVQIERMIDTYLAFLDLCLESQTISLSEVDVTETVLQGKQTTFSCSTVYQRFAKQAKDTPAAVAIRCDGIELTYQALAQQVCQKAGYLEQHGLEVEELVGICLNRSTELVVWMLACQAAGVTYIPLDPDYPQARLEHIVEHSKLSYVITNNTARFAACIDAAVDTSGFAEHEPCRVIGNSVPMYVIYTSGSTGLPKGVVISHSAFANFTDAMKDQFKLRAENGWLAVTSVSFDISALELYLPLVSGATVVVATEQQTRDSQMMIDLLNHPQISHCQATPTTWRTLTETGWTPQHLTILSGGEAMDSKLAKALSAGNTTCFNLYGPTETTVWSTIKRIDGEVSLGLPINNTQLHILNAQLQAVPKGAVGQLWIAGSSLAVGYIHDDELTRQRFVANPQTGELMYNTGDLVSLDDNSELRYHGRADHQVKLSGYRIELEEIEQVIRQSTQVNEAAVVVREISAQSQLVAFVSGDICKDEVITLCAAKLPSYMVPQQVVLLDQLPLTPNRKIDRKALPEINFSHEIVALPQTQTEQTIAEHYCQMLGLDEVDRTHAFYQLGGRSLLAMRLAYSISQQFSVPLTVADFIELASIERIGAYVDSLSCSIKTESFAEEFSI